VSTFKFIILEEGTFQVTISNEICGWSEEFGELSVYPSV